MVFCLSRLDRETKQRLSSKAKELGARKCLQQCLSALSRFLQELFSLQIGRNLALILVTLSLVFLLLSLLISVVVFVEVMDKLCATEKVLLALIAEKNIVSPSWVLGITATNIPDCKHSK